MTSPNLASVKEFNLYQNMVMVSDEDRDGKVSSADKAYAQKDFGEFKAGQEVPFNRYQFLMKGYTDKAGKAWAQEGRPAGKKGEQPSYESQRAAMTANDSLSKHGIRIKAYDTQSDHEGYEVYKNGQLQGRIWGEYKPNEKGERNKADKFGAARLERLALEVSGEKNNKLSERFTVTDEAKSRIAKFGFKQKDEREGDSDEPRTVFHHKNPQKSFEFRFVEEDQVVCRAGEKSDTVEFVSKKRDGSVVKETLNLKDPRLSFPGAPKVSARPAGEPIRHHQQLRNKGLPA